MGSKRNTDMSATETKVKIVESADASAPEGAAQEAPKVSSRKTGQDGRSTKYKATRSQVDKTKFYEPQAALELVKKLSYSSFAGTISAQGVVKEVGSLGNVTFPHSTGKSVKVGIVDEALIDEIASGSFDYDYIITTPQFMPKLAKHARVLGPRGLMPNPKNGTVTEKPEQKKKELESGTFTLKTERKAPVFHVSIGKTDMPIEELTTNLEYLIKILGLKVKKLVISASMSPSVKVAV